MNRPLRRYTIYTLFLAFLIIFQSLNVYSHVSIKRVSPDFLLVGIACISFFLGPLPGEVIGFIIGIVVDIISGGLLGISAFLYTILGFGFGTIGEKVFESYLFISVLTLFMATLVKALILAMLAIVFLKPGYFGFFKNGRIFLEAVFNGTVAPLFFFLVSKIERKYAG